MERRERWSCFTLRITFRKAEYLMKLMYAVCRLESMLNPHQVVRCVLHSVRPDRTS